MSTHKRDEAQRHRLALAVRATEDRADVVAEEAVQDVVFDFSTVQRPGFGDLSLILTARLHASPEDRVWVRALPESTWRTLRGLGLDHLFRIYPGTEDVLH